ncbi:methyl-accepting chemotaxis protein [Sphaerotilus mobilis]|uniref:Methyl-accepting chemotaxis protein n=1 Tax=Sphaerotilus mobilis TaxID=47994 RepID=A0A4Q7LD04_9BURK|nr:methyl-accepting chemotaxis protein [Sphaerotilus mobilis]RZS52276.1 methyl-accepting chemotaxis protein [Sphaerotilus mobilis]
MKRTNLRLSTRLFLAFGTIVLMSIVASALALFQLRAIQANLDDIVKDNNVKLSLNAQMTEAVGVVDRGMRSMMLLYDPFKRGLERQKIHAARARYDQAHDALAAMPASAEGVAKRQAIDDARAVARPLNDKIIDLAIKADVGEAINLLLNEGGKSTQRWQEAISENLAFQEARNQEQYAEALAAYAFARNLLIGAALVSLLTAGVLATLVVRGVVDELGAEPAEVADALHAVANSDLSRSIRVRAGDQHSVMAGLARMQASLSGVVATVRGNAESVATASSQIAQGNADLSQRTEQQASALQQTAATMEELGTTVRSNADNARQANQLAQGASDVAGRGGEVVGRVVDTMKSINDSSKKIADIISVIDGIAFQTNILALNAAVEAARAGEQGRGFAVVAAEVRTLAQRSAGAAREIKSLITASVEQVEQGTSLVDQAGQTMDEIVGAIRRVTDIVAEISAASSEQSSGVSQVGQAVTQMDQVTQQNAALVEESAAAAESLKSQAQALVQTVSVFQLGGHGAGAEHVTASAHASAPASAAAKAHATPVLRPAVKSPARSPAPAKAAAARKAPAVESTPPAPAPAAATASAGVDDSWETF